MPARPTLASRMLTGHECRAVAAGLAALAMLHVAGCRRTESGGDALARVKKQGVIVAGFAGEAPYAYEDGGRLTGQDPAVHRAIWSALGIAELRGVRVDFGQLIPALNANRFDVVAAGVFILPERCDQAAFSEPVYCAPSAFLVPRGNPAKLSDFASVAKAGIQLGVLPGAAEGLYASRSGVPADRIVQLATQRDGMAAVTSGRVGAFALTSISLRRMLADGGGGLEMTEPFTPVIDGKEQRGCGAAVFRKGDDDLRQAFNTELARLKKERRLQPLMEPFGFGPETLPPEGVTTAQLCSK